MPAKVLGPFEPRFVPGQQVHVAGLAGPYLIIERWHLEVPGGCGGWGYLLDGAPWYVSEAQVEEPVSRVLVRKRGGAQARVGAGGHPAGQRRMQAGAAASLHAGDA